jgi:hypothetical protein
LGEQTARRVRPGDFPPPPTIAEFRRLEEERRRGKKLAKLQFQLKEETKKLAPKCTTCGGTDIRMKTSSHLVSPGNNIIGPAGRGPRFSTYVDYLYCEDCGNTYYKSGVAKLENLMREIRNADDELSELRHPHMC